MENIDQVDPAWAWDVYQPDSNGWGRPQVAHFHRRAGFGANDAALDKGVRMTPEELAKYSIAGANSSDASTQQANQLAATIMAGGDTKKLSAAWVYRLLYTEAPLLEKMTLFWHGHFATSGDKVQDASMMWNQNQLLRKHALGEFEPMVQAIARDPAMLVYLDSATNRKAHPNENFARELMELFCLGEGNYTEQDVQQVARCFTGWEIKSKLFRKNSYQHDGGEKSFLGRAGNFDGEDAVRIVLEQDTMPTFIVGKLVRYFVFDEPSAPPRLLKPLADEFRANGLKIAPIVQRILSSNLFYSPHAFGRKVRSPVDFVVGILRSLEATTNTVQLAEGLNQLGQGLFYPPSVKGWDGGRAWINSSTLLGRSNLFSQILSDETTQFAKRSLSEFLEGKGHRTSAGVVDWVEGMLLAVTLNERIKKQLAEIVGDRNEPQAWKSLIHSMITLPEMQIA